MLVSEHTAYKKARVLSNLIWKVTRSWDKFSLSTIGNQIVRSSDSVSANLAEGWSRYSKKDKCNFFVIAKASAAETRDWIEKSFERKLLSPVNYNEIINLLDEIPKDINGLIKGVNNNLKK